MPLETEVKLRVKDHGPAREALKKNGAKFVRRELETNTFLDTDDRTLLSQGSGLRVRLAKDLDSDAKKVVITHKGPKRAGGVKIREETELRCESYDDAVALLNVLGFRVTLSFEKRRETWDLGECEVVLDELPGGMGLFVEVEGPDERCVQDVRAKLGLKDAEVEASGYATMIAGKLRGSGRGTLSF